MTHDNQNHSSRNDREARHFIRRHGRTLLREVIRLLAMDYPIYLIAQELNIDESSIEKIKNIHTSEVATQRKIRTS